MDAGIISMRYAKALLSYARGNKAEDKVYEEMQILSRSFAKFPALRSAIDNPVLKYSEKISLICNAAGIKVSEEFTRFVGLVLKERREKYLQSMSLMYIDLYRKLKNIAIGKLITAWPVSKEMEDRMKQMVVRRTHGTVEFEMKVDPSLEGGFIFEAGTYRLDASVASQFKRVKRQFIEKNRRIV